MIKLIVLDVDGCLTDGSIIYDTAGNETKAFNVKDGLAIKSWMQLGNYAAIITGRQSAVVERRAKELGITHFFQGVKKKGEKLREILDELGLKPENTAAIGDDLNDLPMLKMAAMAFCPADANPMIHPYVDRVLDVAGGRGAAARMVGVLVDREGLTREYLDLWK